MAQAMNIPVIGVVENYSYLKCPDCGKEIAVFGKSRIDEIAEELGLLDKVVAEGWKSLSAKETGRIGGLMTKKKKEMKAKVQREDEERESLIEELL